MYKRHKYDIIIILSLAGFGISLYLAITHYLGIAVPCSITQGCEAVLSSKYSSLLGLPLSVWGGVFFTGVIGSSLLANHYLKWQKLLKVLLGIGAVASLIFLSIQFFVLRQVCQYCATVDVLTVIIFLWDLNIEYKN